MNTLHIKCQNTDFLVGLLEVFDGEQSQGSAVDARLCTEEPLKGMVGLATVCWPCMVDHLPLFATSIGIPAG